MKMGLMKTKRFQNIEDIFDAIPAEEWLILDVLRGFVKDKLPPYCKEKISYNVPYFYGNRGICIIWPATIPRGGIKEGVLFGFWQGYKLKDVDNYLTKGTNKKVFYKIYKSVEEIKLEALDKLICEAILVDQGSK